MTLHDILRLRQGFLGCDPDVKLETGSEDDLLSASPLMAGVPSGFDSGAPHIIPVTRPERYQVGPSCAGNAGARMIEVLSDAVGAPLPEISGTGVWYLARQRHGRTHERVGTQLRCVMEALSLFGPPTREDWPEDTAFDKGPSIVARERAYDFRTSGYYKIETSMSDEAVLDQFEQAIRWNHPVAVGFDVDETYLHHVNSSDTVLFEPSGPSLGGHANMVHGVRGRKSAREFLVENWWPLFTYAWVSASFMIATRDPWCLTLPPKPV